MDSTSQIKKEPDIESLNRQAVYTIENFIHGTLSNQQHVVIGLCGGRSVGAIYEILGKNTTINWSKVHFFMLDERLVPITHPESNFKLASETLINPLLHNKLVSKENIHPFIFDENTADKGTTNYTNEINKLGGHFDIAILSSGEDGHIGGIYPNHHSFENTSQGFIAMNDSPKPPPERMTMSKSLFLKTKCALLLVCGEAKRDALNKIVDNKTSPEDCPAALVKQIPQWELLTDLT